LLRTEVEQIKKTVEVFNVVDNVSDIGAPREQGVHRINEFIFVCKNAFIGFCVRTAASCPQLDASEIAAPPATFVVQAAQMDQVSSAGRHSIGFLCG
jgi:hypothetical protein